MSGLRNILLVLCCSVAAIVADNVPASTDIQISALGLGEVNVSWGHRRILPGNHVYRLTVKTPDMEAGHTEASNENFYMFNFLAVHRGLSVRVEEKEVINEEMQNECLARWESTLPPFTGDEGTEPLRLTCDMHYNKSDMYWLSCDWLPGANASLDTLYYFYFRNAYFTKECPKYVTEPGGGRRIGCRTLFSDTLISENFLVHINGSSHSQHIRAIERVFKIDDIGVIPPVQNLTFNMEDRRLSWAKPTEHPDSCFKYQINLWSKDKNETITVSKVQHFWNEDLQAPTNKHHVRVRAIGKAPCWIMERYSSWTEVIHIDDTKEDIRWITFTICLLISCLAVFLLCIRIWSSLFPQIPKPKDDLKDAFNNAQHQALMRCNSWDTEEVISYIEVMGSLDKQYKMSADYGHVAV